MPSCYVSICFIAWTCDFVWRVWYALYCVVPLIPGLFESPLLLVCVMHCWCGKEWMHILHKSKGRLLFQECTGRNPPEKDLTYNHKNGHKWCMIVLLKEPRNAPGPPTGAHQVIPVTHLCLTCVNLHKSTSLCFRRWFVWNTGFYYQPSTPAKASPALYLLLIGMKRLVITGILVGRCLLLWVLIQEMKEECTDRPTSQRIKLSMSSVLCSLKSPTFSSVPFCFHAVVFILKSLWSDAALVRLPGDRWLAQCQPCIWHWAVDKIPPLPLRSQLKLQPRRMLSALGDSCFLSIPSAKMLEK